MKTQKKTQLHRFGIMIRLISAALTLLCLIVFVSSCGKAFNPDFTDDVTFEAALNKGQDLVGKTVRFTAGEINPQSAFGYNIYAGEHLNFVSSTNPKVKQGDVITVKVVDVQNVFGSWIISYEFVK